MSAIGRRDLLKLLGTAGGAAAVGSLLPACRKAADARATVRLGYLPLTDHLTVIAAARSAFSSLDLQPVKFASWPELAEAVKAGAVEAAFALTPIALALRGKGVPVKLVLLGHRNGSALTVKAGAAVSTIADLKGQAIAVPSRFSTHHLILRRMLEGAGLQAGDVRIVEMPPPEMVQALSTDRIGAFIVAEPFGGQAELQGVGKVLAFSKDVWPNHVCCGLLAREDLIDARGGSVQELVDGLVDAGRFIGRSPAEAAKLSTRYLGQKEEVVLHVLTHPRDRVTFDDLVPTRADLEATQADLLRFGIAAAPVDLGAFLDDRFARKAYGR
ncbi:MAG TPA: ABC transporter substrate-binding protein [Anaeromyxobacteraceae bacterium]|nr:ABC transporter substrate-binding protein [Anaeromyxobacteraceae bacterium]